MMGIFGRAATAGAIGVAILAAIANAAVAGKAFDMGPDQKERVHTTAGKAAKALPANYAYVKPGTFVMAMAPFLPPTSYFATDEKTVIGANADLASLIAEKLGLKLEIQVVAWPDWPLGVSSGKYDAFISDVTVTEERKEKFDFSTYGNDVIGFYVGADSAIAAIDEPKDISGLRVIVASGTNHERILLDWNAKNEAAGLKPAELLYFDDPTAAHLALLSGRADATFVNNSEGAYSAAVNGETRLVGIVSGGWPLTAELGVVTRKGSGLDEAVTTAINELIAEGSYVATLRRWSIEGQAVDRARTNPPGLPKS